MTRSLRGLAAKRQRRAAASADARRQAKRAAQLSLVDRVRRAGAGPLICCELSPDLFDTGRGALVLARGLDDGTTALFAALLDPWCVGIKEVVLRRVSLRDLDMFLEQFEDSVGLAAVAPGHARKLLADLVAYGRSLGFAPPREFVAAELLLADFELDTQASFVFGRDGRPFYMPSGDDRPAAIRQVLAQLTDRLGKDGFDYLLPLGRGGLPDSVVAAPGPAAAAAD